MVVAGAISAVGLPGLLSTSLAVPGTSSQTADALLARHFGENPEGTFTVVFRAGIPSTRVLSQLDRRVMASSTVLPNAHTSPPRGVAGIAYSSVSTSLDLQHAASYTDALRAALKTPNRIPAYVTGEPAIQHDLNLVLAADLRRGEAIALPAALVVLALVLGMRAILLVPLLFAGCTISAGLAIVFLLAHVVLMVSYVPNLVELVGLGLAIDYSLLLVQRFREEVAHGGTVEDAVVRTMGTAGRTVLFSGAAVAIGLSAVLIMPVPFIRSLGVAGVIVPLVSMVAALTIQPVLLSLLGRAGAHEQRDVERRALWSRLARVVLDRSLLVVACALALLAALALPGLQLQLTPGSLSGIPQFMESARGLQLLRDRVGPGAITPLEVVVDLRAAGRAGTASAATLRLASTALDDPEVFIAAIGPRPPYVDATRRYRRIVIYPRHEFGDRATQQLVARVRNRLIPAARFPAGSHIWTGGAPAQGVDFLNRVYGAFPWIVLAVLVLAYIVLLRAFRSLLLPLLAVVLDAVSVAATYGMLVLVFQLGVGAELLGLYRTAQIEAWVPVLLFATLFGLSMDYQVFLVSRMREAWDSGASTDGAIGLGLVRTGRIVSAAAVIMVASFSGFMAGRVAGLQELGAGLALGVLLDATVVRILVMPGLMALMGRWSWWLPASVAGLARVEASPLAAREGRGLPEGA